MKSGLFKTLIYIVLTLVFITVGGVEAKASHLVGGDLTYQCLGGNRYKIVLTVRRDCNLAFPDALFDDPASIGVFDKDYKLLTELAANGQILIPFNDDDTLNQVLINRCTVTTGDVCVHETRYEIIINLPIRSGGYNFVYQRCCRNSSLTNTLDPLNTGMTLVAHLSEKAMQLCNSSPVFKKWPAIYICMDQPIQFDHSATDGNGDSLVYRLVTPYSGATREIPRPQPPNAGPYADITWSSSAYSVNNMLGSPDAENRLRIDPRTGLLVGTPTVFGQFVVGIVVDEYRGGELISSIRRDFQYNVRNCAQDIIAQMEAPGGLCGGERTINFKNASLNAPFIQWFFDYPNNLSATSREQNPTYTYPAEGVYTVMLIAGVQGACMDTLKRQISVFDEPLFIDLDYEPLSCSNENLRIRLIDLSSDPNGTINKWRWTISNGSTLLVQNVQAPEITVPHNQPITVTLEIESSSGCTGTFTKVIVPRFIKEDISVENIVVCPGDTTVINPIRGTLPPGVSIQWLAGQLNLLGDLNSQTIRFISSSLGSVYAFFNVSNNSGCSFKDSVRIDVLYKPALNFSLDNSCGTNEVQIENLTPDATNFSWNIESKDTSIIPKSFVYIFNKSGSQVITLKTSDGCAPSLSKTIYLLDSSTVFSNLKRDARGCPGDQVALNPGGDPDLLYTWAPAEFFTDPHAVNPTITVGPSTTNVTVTITHRNNPECSLATGFQVINLVEEILKNLPDTFSACPGIAITLNAGGSTELTYEWSPPALFSNPNIPSPTLTTNDDVTIKVKITDPNNTNCFAEKTIQVIIGVDAVIEALPDTVETCPGNQITLNLGGKTEYKYEWSPPGLFNDPNAVSPTITVDTHTVIGVKVTDVINGNCSASKDILLWIPVLDAINKLPDSIISCFGAPVNLNPNGSKRFTYQWSPADKVDNARSVNPIATVSETTVFTVIISDSATDCQLTGTVRVIVPPAFELTSNNDTTLCVTDSVLLSVQIQGGLGVTIIWRNSQGEVISTQNEIIIKPNGSGIFTATGTDVYGCTRTLNKNIYYLDSTTIFSDLKRDARGCPGDQIELNPGGDTNWLYTWSPVEFFTDPHAVNPIVTIGSSTVNVSVTISHPDNPDCSITTSFQVVNLVADVLKNLPDTISACPGVAITLNAGGTTELTYEWTPPALFSNPRIASPILTTNDDVTIKVKITDPNNANCFAEKTIQVIIGIDAVIEALPDTIETCPGDEITLNAGGNANYKYEWSPPGLFGDPNAVSPTITVDKHTVIGVKVTDVNNGNCSASKDILLWIPVLDAINKLPDSLISCFGAPVNLNPNGSNRFTYQWSPADKVDNASGVNPVASVSETTVFTVTISDAAKDCQLTGTIKVIVPPAFELITNINDTTLCATDSIRLTAQVRGGIGVTIAWKNPQGEVISTQNEIDLKPNGSGNFTVTATDAYGCTRSQSFMLIRGTLDISIDLSPDGVICSGDEINLSVINNRPEQKLTYQWKADPSITSGLNGASITAKPQDTTTYEVTVTNGEGCSKTLTYTVNVVPFDIDVVATSNPYTIDLGKTSQLNVTTVPGHSYKWEPAGTLDRDNVANPIAKPTETTIYTATVTSPEGCSASDTTIVNIIIPDCAEPFLFIPNAFTPNGDGHNDILYVRGNTIDEMELIIYNRWGQQVFRSTSQSFGWDGRFNGGVANPDVYGFYLRILCIGGETFTKKGNISLLR